MVELRALEGRTRCSDGAAAVRVHCRLPTTKMRQARRGSWPPRTAPRSRRRVTTAARRGLWTGRAPSAAAMQQLGLGKEQDRSCPRRWLGPRKLAALMKPQRREGGTRRASRATVPKFGSSLKNAHNAHTLENQVTALKIVPCSSIAELRQDVFQKGRTPTHPPVVRVVFHSSSSSAHPPSMGLRCARASKWHSAHSSRSSLSPLDSIQYTRTQAVTRPH